MKNEQDKISEGSVNGNPTISKLTDWTKEPSVMDLKNDFDACKSAHDNHVLNVRRWTHLRNATGPSRPKKIKGRSNVQPKLIRRQAEWRYSALSEPFLSTEKLFNLNPVTFEDEFASAQNELVLNWPFRTNINKVKFIDDYVRTGVAVGTVMRPPGVAAKPPAWTKCRWLSSSIWRFRTNRPWPCSRKLLS